MTDQVSAPSRQPPMSTPVRHHLRADGQSSSAWDITSIMPSAKRDKKQKKKYEAQKSLSLVKPRVGQAHSARSNSCNDRLRQEGPCGGD
ncbi:hypothetical protein GB937_002964 [Aspergillus fischeri]|nr:hypothetical protein GB937_002964 [Aspergillus fischeri]